MARSKLSCPYPLGTMRMAFLRLAPDTSVNDQPSGYSSRFPVSVLDLAPPLHRGWRAPWPARCPTKVYLRRRRGRDAGPDSLSRTRCAARERPRDDDELLRVIAAAERALQRHQPGRVDGGHAPEAQHQDLARPPMVPERPSRSAPRRRRAARRSRRAPRRARADRARTHPALAVEHARWVSSAMRRMKRNAASTTPRYGDHHVEHHGGAQKHSEQHQRRRSSARPQRVHAWRTSDMFHATSSEQPGERRHRDERHERRQDAGRRAG